MAESNFNRQAKVFPRDATIMLFRPPGNLSTQYRKNRVSAPWQTTTFLANNPSSSNARTTRLRVEWRPDNRTQLPLIKTGDNHGP